MQSGQPLFRYEKVGTTLFRHLQDIRQRLVEDVSPYIDLVQAHAQKTNVGIGNFSMIRMLMPVIETVAKAVKVSPQDLLSQLNVRNPYLTWSIFRDVFMHNDEFEAAIIEVDGRKLTVSPALAITFPNTPALHTTTSEYLLINPIGLYESLIDFIDRTLSDENNDNNIKIVVGVEYLDRSNKEIQMIEKEIRAIKSK